MKLQYVFVIQLERERTEDDETLCVIGTTVDMVIAIQFSPFKAQLRELWIATGFVATKLALQGYERIARPF